jgi:hypothetical protein
VTSHVLRKFVSGRTCLVHVSADTRCLYTHLYDKQRFLLQGIAVCHSSPNSWQVHTVRKYDFSCWSRDLNDLKWHQFIIRDVIIPALHWATVGRIATSQEPKPTLSASQWCGLHCAVKRQNTELSISPKESTHPRECKMSYGVEWRQVHKYYNLYFSRLPFVLARKSALIACYWAYERLNK